MKKLLFYFPTILVVLGLSIGFNGCGSDDSGPSGVQLSAPQNLAATAQSDHSIMLTWTDEGLFKSGFRLQRAPAGAEDWQQIAELGENAASYTDEGLDEGTTYRYRIRSFSQTAESPFSQTATATTLPAAPTGLSASRSSETEIEITWNDNSSVEDGYELQRSLSQGSGFETVTTLAADVSEYSDSELNSNTTYYYRVRATMTGDIVSGWSNVSSATTSAAPQNLAAEPASATSIRLTWTDESPDEYGYMVERATGEEVEWLQVARIVDHVDNYTDINLSEGTVYRYRVKTFTINIESPYSDEATGTTLPHSPSNLRVSQEESADITLTWRDNSAKEDGFELQRGLSLDGEFQTIAADLDIDSEMYVDENPPPNVTYYYRVRTHLGGQSSAWSNVATATTSSSPQNLTAEALSHNSIVLTWTDVSDLESGFHVQRVVGNDENWREVAELDSNITTFTNYRLEEGTAYRYRVSSFTRNTESAFSDIASATTLLIAPTNLAAVRQSASQIILSWVDNSGAEDSYEIQRSLSAGGEFATIFETAANASVFVDEYLEQNTTFYYRLRAANSDQSSEWSNVSSATTTVYVPNAPSDLAAEATSPYQVRVTWTDNAINERGFIIQKSLDGEGNWLLAASYPTPDLTSGTIQGLISNTTYFLRTIAYNDSGWSDFSNIAQVTTDPGPPQAPGYLQAEAVDFENVALTWVDNATDETGFIIERMLTDEGQWVVADSTAENVAAYNYTNVIPRLTYLFRVRAYNDYGLSNWSNTVQVTIPDYPIRAPSNLTASTAGIDRIRVTWRDRSDNEEGFIVERQAPGEQNFRPVADILEDSYLDEGLEIEATYIYRVKAYFTNQGNFIESEYSNADSATTWAILVFEDDFEDYERDAPPDDDAYDIQITGESTALVTAASAHESEQGLHIADPDTGSNFLRMFLNHGDVPIGSVSFWINMSDTGFFGLRGYDAHEHTDQTLAFILQFNADSTFILNNGANWAEGDTFAVNEWFLLEIQYNVETRLYSVLFDGEVVIDGYQLIRANHTAIRSLEFIVFSNEEIEHVYIDDILIEHDHEEEMQFRRPGSNQHRRQVIGPVRSGTEIQVVR